MTVCCNAFMNAALHKRWLAMAQSLPWRGDAEAVWKELHAHYSEPVRAYHNLRHIAACLRAFDSASKEGMDATAVELAIWFHDVIYDPRAKDNEIQSAELFANLATQAAVEASLIATVKSLILATQHKALPQTPEEQLLADADLSILGADEDAFAEYERQIRQEYDWVPELEFCAGRAAVLGQFLRRKRIFHTRHFYQGLETVARENLSQAIRNWQGAMQ